MRKINYITQSEKLLTPDVVSMLSTIHEFKGKQELYVKQKQDSLTHLLEVAKIQSTEASNKIEGIYTSDERLKKLVLSKTNPTNRSEQEIAGYRDALSTIHDNYEYIPLKPSVILQLHRDLYKYSGSSIGGSYKNSDNVIAETDEKGNRFVRFRPVPAWETAEAIELIFEEYDKATSQPDIDPLLLIPMMILDFLCVHPFNDGNGRMSRLLTLLALYKNGYIVGKYVSIEKAIEETKESYYKALRNGSAGWHENENDYLPFVRYMLGIIVATYREFEKRINAMPKKGETKQDAVREVIKSTVGKITKAEIIERCPNISEITIQRTLANLVKSGEILKISGGRYTSYVWNGEDEK